MWPVGTSHLLAGAQEEEACEAALLKSLVEGMYPLGLSARHTENNQT